MEGASARSVLSVLGSLRFILTSLVSNVMIAETRQLKDSGSSQEAMISLPLCLTTVNKDLPGLESINFFFCFLQLSRKKPPDISCTDLLGNTPLHSAAYRSQRQCALKLLRSGADPNVKNKNGTTGSARHSGRPSQQYSFIQFFFPLMTSVSYLEA